MSTTIPHEVFLSHSSLDRQFADDLAAMMRRHGVPVWYSQTNIMGAQQWQDEIGAALRRCDWFMVVLSPQSVNSMWVKRELSYALDQGRLENRIIPVRHQPADYDQLHWTLSILQAIDFTGTFDAGSVALMRMWGLGYRQQL
jgi:hypothetical protein